MNWIVSADFPTPGERNISKLHLPVSEYVLLTTTTDNHELVLPQKLCLYIVG